MINSHSYNTGASKYPNTIILWFTVSILGWKIFTKSKRLESRIICDDKGVRPNAIEDTC